MLVLGTDGRVLWANAAAENLFEVSRKKLLKLEPEKAFVGGAALASAISKAVASGATYTEQELELGVAGRPRLHLTCTATPVEIEGADVLLEFRHIDQQLKIAREERLNEQQQANRELIRSLAHEIKNPLGGIRGAAQLLDRELDRPALHEYTQVIMKEADRLQQLMDRLLTPHRLPQPGMINIHETLERVRSLLLAEFPEGISVRRDYDTSLPLMKGDKEQIIQALLNVARNAAQAIKAQGAADGKRGEIRFRTRIARQVVLARKRYRHAIEVQVIDNGPGVPAEIRDRIFYPLVSGREGGSGLGLTIAQTFITQQHQGAITLESAPGRTCFNILLPLRESANVKT